MRRALSLVLSFILCAVLACSCASAAKVEDYLGEYDYEAPAICMVYEPVEGEFDEEGNALYGIQYREVTDLEGLLKVPDTTFLLYFYNSLDSTAWTVTAVVEDIAEAEEGKLVVLALDQSQYTNLTSQFGISAVPDFALVRNYTEISVFGSADYDSWSVDDIVIWLDANGYPI
jgi:hypothetical protein